MKKLLFFVATIVTLFLVSCASQQLASKKSLNDVKLGAKAGVTFSDITGDDVDSFSGRTAFHVGILAEIMIHDSFAFQPELLYSAQGSDWSEDFGGDAFEGSYKVDYLNVPLMAKFYVAEGFSLEAGPQVGLLLSAKAEGDFADDDLKDYLKGIDFGVNFGVGYKLESGLNFGARYNLGLSDANDDPDYLGDSTYKNSVIQAYVGYFF